VDKAMEMGINWWQQDPYLSSEAKDSYISSDAKEARLEKENKTLKSRLERVEAKIR
jgi:hypothetical protein